VRAPIYVYHFTQDKESIYVLKEQTKGANIKPDELDKRVKSKKKTTTTPPAPTGPGSMMPGGGPGGPTGPGGMMGPPTGPSGPGFPSGSMGGPPPGMAGMMPGGGPSAGALKDLGIVPQ